jgi:hypothetical protein
MVGGGQQEGLQEKAARQREISAIGGRLLCGWPSILAFGISLSTASSNSRQRCCLPLPLLLLLIILLPCQCCSAAQQARLRLRLPTVLKNRRC